MSAMSIGMFFVSYISLFLVSGLAIVSQILLAVAINRDSIALGLPQGKTFTVLTALFGGIPAGAYFIYRANKIVSEGDANFAPSSKMARTSIILYVISCVLSIAVLFGLFNSMLDIMQASIYM